MDNEIKITITLRGHKDVLLAARDNIKEFVEDVVSENVEVMKVDCEDDFYR